MSLDPKDKGPGIQRIAIWIIIGLLGIGMIGSGLVGMFT